MIRLRLSLLFSLLLTAVCCTVIAEEMACAHFWEVYDIKKHGVQQAEISLYMIEDETHAYMFRRPEKVCRNCGERSYVEPAYASATSLPHSYTLKSWNRMNDGAVVRFTLVCGVCCHEYTAEVTVEEIVDQTANSCLRGGPCDERKPAHKFENGMLMFDSEGLYLPYGFDPGEKEVYDAIIYDPVEHTFCHARREYCALCGRPRNASRGYFQPQMFRSTMNGLPIMEEEYFFTDDMPNQLLYQLFDQLRKEVRQAAS